MQHLEELIISVNKSDIEAFRKLITAQDLLIFKTEEIHTNEDINDRYYKRDTQRKFSILHIVIRAYFIEGLQHLLTLNPDLQQLEIEGGKSEREGTMFGAEICKVEEKSTALELISKSGNRAMIQLAFDYICTHDLHQKAEYDEFMYKHVRKVNLKQFRAEFLNFNVQSPLGRFPGTAKQLRQWLSENGIDVTNVFFTVEEYFTVLTMEPHIEEVFLKRALIKCEFNQIQARQIYTALTNEDFKRLVAAQYPRASVAITGAKEAATDDPKKPSQKRDRSSLQMGMEKFLKQPRKPEDDDQTDKTVRVPRKF